MPTNGFSGCGNYRVLYPYKTLTETQRDNIKVILPGEMGGINATISGNRVVDVKSPLIARLFLFSVQPPI